MEERIAILENYLYQEWIKQKPNNIDVKDFLRYEFDPTNTITLTLAQLRNVFNKPILIYPQDIILFPKLTNNIITIKLSNIFKDNKDLVYLISDNITSNKYNDMYDYSISPVRKEDTNFLLDSNDIIDIIPDYRGTRYVIEISAIQNNVDINYIYDAKTSIFLDIIEEPVPPIKIIESTNTNIYFTNNLTIECNLDLYFEQDINDPDDKISFNYTVQNLSDLLVLYEIVNNKLVINQDYRGTDYKLLVTVSNNIYTLSENSLIINVFELDPFDIVIKSKEVIGRDDSIDLNIIDFVKTNRDVNVSYEYEAIVSKSLRANLRDVNIPIVSTDDINKIIINPDYRGKYIDKSPVNTLYSVFVTISDKEYINQKKQFSINIEEVPPPLPRFVQGKEIDLGERSNVILRLNLYDFIKSSTLNTELEFLPAVDYSSLIPAYNDIFILAENTLTLNIKALDQDIKPQPLYYSIYAVDTLYNVSLLEMDKDNHLIFKVQQAIVK